MVLAPLDSNRYSSLFVSKWTGSSPAQIVCLPKRVVLGRGAKLCSSLQCSFKVRHLMVAPVWEAEGKCGTGGGGGGRGGGAGGPLRHAVGSLVKLVPSSSVLSSSSQRSEKSKVLRQRRAAGSSSELQDWSKSQVRGLSLVWSDSFIGLSELSVTQKQVLLMFGSITSTNQLVSSWEKLTPRSTLLMLDKTRPSWIRSDSSHACLRPYVPHSSWTCSLLRFFFCAVGQPLTHCVFASERLWMLGLTCRPQRHINRATKSQSFEPPLGVLAAR